MAETSDFSLVDSRDLLLFVYVTPDGVAHMGGKTQDWEWVAQSLRHLADRADRRAADAMDPTPPGGKP